MDRRTFLASLAAVLATRAQGQTPRVARVAFLHPAAAEDSSVYKELVPGLEKLGYVDGKTMRLDVRSGRADPQAIPRLLEDMLAHSPDVLIVTGPAATKAAVAMSRSTPVVAIDLESDPVVAGWMASLSRPGGHVTGLFLDLTGTSVKWLQLLREVVPNVRDVALVWDTSTGGTQLAAARAAAGQFGFTAHVVPIDNFNAFEDAMRPALHVHSQALVILSSPVAFQFSTRVADFALRNSLPAISPFRPFAESGGLMSYGPDLTLFFQRTAPMVDRILKGARAGEIAVEQPVKYDLVLNQKTARSLGIDLPRPVLLRADEVIR